MCLSRAIFGICKSKLAYYLRQLETFSLFWQISILRLCFGSKDQVNIAKQLKTKNEQ